MPFQSWQTGEPVPYVEEDGSVPRMGKFSWACLDTFLRVGVPKRKGRGSKIALDL